MYWTCTEYLHCILLLKTDTLSACEHCLMPELLVMLALRRNDRSGLLLQVSVAIVVCGSNISGVSGGYHDCLLVVADWKLTIISVLGEGKV